MDQLRLVCQPFVLSKIFGSCRPDGLTDSSSISFPFIPLLTNKRSHPQHAIIGTNTGATVSQKHQSEAHQQAHISLPECQSPSIARKRVSHTLHQGRRSLRLVRLAGGKEQLS